MGDKIVKPATAQKEIIANVAKATGLTYQEASRVYDNVFAEIIKGLKRGDRVLTPIGSFSIVNYPARNGVNPRTRATILISARNKVKFIGNQMIKDELN